LNVAIEEDAMRVALGTVQFGLIYGVSGVSARLSRKSIREILQLAFRRGITTLDTAPVYGDIESRLALLSEDLEFEINSKIPAIPQYLSAAAAANWVIESARSSHKRLGDKLKGLLFHQADDLSGVRGNTVWRTLLEWAGDKGVCVGVSGYDPELIQSLCGDYGFSIIQMPGNALDQRHRVLATCLERKPRLQLRSAFLQGLLLMPIELAVERVPAAADALQQWHHWLSDHGLSPLRGALSIVKGFENMDTCVIGVDSASQLMEILDEWDQVAPLSADYLSCIDPRVIDPRLWRDWRQ
jgi:aryl-alcohol dehydrogenase-like predicted oxidoreductase